MDPYTTPMQDLLANGLGYTLFGVFVTLGVIAGGRALDRFRDAVAREDAREAARHAATTRHPANDPRRDHKNGAAA